MRRPVFKLDSFSVNKRDLLLFLCLSFRANKKSSFCVIGFAVNSFGGADRILLCFIDVGGIS